MDNLKVLNSHELKEIYSLLEKQWGYSEKLDYVFLMNGKNNIFITNRDFTRLELKKLRINNVGLYFGELMEGDRLRLSIEGSQIIGPFAKKNVVRLDEQEGMRWLKGFEIEKECEKGIVIIKIPIGFAGCGTSKDNRILNYVPKTRRIQG